MESKIESKMAFKNWNFTLALSLLMTLNDLNVPFLLLYHLLIRPVMEMTNQASVLVLGNHCLALYIFTERILSRVIVTSIIVDQRKNSIVI